MFKNYFKIAIRNLLRYKGFSFINIAGLAIGMACCILIFIYIQDELKYDKFHQKKDRIYRVIREEKHKSRFTGVTPFLLAPSLKKDFPEIEESVRIRPRGGLVSYKNKRFHEDGFYYADPKIFKVFTFPLIKGNPNHVLTEPNTVVITEKMAKKYFGNEDPIGMQLELDNEILLRITGVMKDVPQNSHITFDFVAPITNFVKLFPEDYLNNWHDCSFYTYVLLPPNYSPSELENKLPSFLERHMDYGVSSYLKLHLQPLTGIYLHSANITFDEITKGDIVYIYIFSIIGILILIIACINYMNLATACYTKRIREVGLRKVVGAPRWQLMKQFLVEPFLLSFLSLIVAFLLAELFLPFLNTSLYKELEINIIGNKILFIGTLSILMIISFVSGIYPAFLLSSYSPISILKGEMRLNKSIVLRRILISLQFTISLILIVSIIVIYNQLKFIKDKNLGFKKEHIVVIGLNWDVKNKYQSFKNELLKYPNVINVSASTFAPPNRLGGCGFLEGNGKRVNMHGMPVRFDYIETLGHEIVVGRSFSKKIATDEGEAFIINETAAKVLGWESPIGKKVKFWGDTGTIIGVVRDFHYWSLHEKVESVIMLVNQYFWYLVARIRSENISGTLNYIKEKWHQFSPNWPFEYRFIDDEIDNLYRTERRLEKIISYFATLAIFIACLGLLGLAAFTAEQRTKEIGIRKVLGASVSSIVVMLTNEFSKWIVLANLIAWPIAYYAMNKWLQNFAYRINIGWWIFLLTGALALVIALLTVSYQAIRAATANPVEALRYE